MRFLLFIASFFTLNNLTAQTSLNVTYLSNHYFPNEDLANLWGYTAPNGTEFALVGGFTGTYIFRIESSGSLTQVAFIDGPDSDWREIKTYTNGSITYAYVVSEGLSPAVGVQVINLSGLTNTTPSVTSANRLVSVPSVGTINKAHALQVDETVGILYVFGTNLLGGRAISLKLLPDPYNPTYDTYLNHVGTASNHGYVHDGYADNNWLFAGHIYQGAFSIAQRTESSGVGTLTEIGSSTPVNTPGNFTHNTWRNGNFIFSTDEVSNSSLTSFDITNLNAVKKLDEIKGLTTNSIVHNTYIKDSYAYTSWYLDGVQIIDVTRPANMVRVGYYDTHSGTGNGFNGCWGVYNYFPSGRIIISNINSSAAGQTNSGELMVLQPNVVRGCYIEGKVTHVLPTGALIQGALVELRTTTGTLIMSTTTSTTIQGATTGTPEGEYKMGYHASGNYTLRVSKAGYITQDVAITISNGVLTQTNVALQLPPAPIELSSFEVAPTKQNTALLTWTTAVERQNLGFSVEHSVNATDWQSIGWVAGAGDSDVEQRYQFESKQLVPGTHYFRLKQSDRDGQFEYTDMRKVTIGTSKWQWKALPNPVAYGQTINLSLDFGTELPEEADLQIEMFNAQQQLLHAQTYSIDQQQLSISLPLQYQPKGIYNVVARIGQEQQTIQVVVQ
jgi:choice-of-anchor B domain-containing protein